MSSRFNFQLSSGINLQEIAFHVFSYVVTTS